MKKIVKIMSVLALAAVVVFATASMVACGETQAEIVKTYVVSESVEKDIGTDYNVYQLHLLSDNTYELVTTTYTYGYSMNLGTYSVESFGTYEKGTSEDGYTSYKLLKADRVILNAYSLAGGFNIYIDTATATYPTELPASGEGDKVYAQSADDVIKAYGAERTVYVSDDKNTFALSNPNA